MCPSCCVFMLLQWLVAECHCCVCIGVIEYVDRNRRLKNKNIGTEREMGIFVKRSKMYCNCMTVKFCEELVVK